MLHVVVICLAMTFASCQVSEEETKCAQLQTVCHAFFPTQFQGVTVREIEGRRGKRGGKGEKGDIGVKGSDGERGPPGIVDYDRVQQMIENRLREVIELQAKNISDLRSEIDQINKRIKQNACHVVLDEKCFVFRGHESQDVTWDEGKRICEGNGSKMANIYSEKHYNEMMTYMKTLIPNERSYVDYWLGMKYDTNSRKVLLSSGTDAPFEKWFRSYPRSDYTSIGFTVDKSPTTAYQHMWNSLTSSTTYGVVCEM